MILQRAMHPQFLSNTYLMADEEGGTAFFVDAGGPLGELFAAAERLELTPTHVLLTHHHYDHVCEAEKLRARWPELAVLIEPRERELLAGGEDSPLVTGTVQAGETLRVGELEIRPLSTPGHTAGMLSFLVGRPTGAPRHATSTAPGGFMGGEAVVFTGDTLFKGSVGGVRAPGHTTCTELRDSIMGTLMELPPQTVIHPGHTEPTSVAAEWEHNPFIRIWRGVDPEGASPCQAFGEPATLILLARDYDGGGKAWVRWEDGRDDIVPGSQVTNAS